MEKNDDKNDESFWGLGRHIYWFFQFFWDLREIANDLKSLYAFSVAVDVDDIVDPVAASQPYVNISVLSSF